MYTWTFDYTQITQPVLRQGAAGLWLLLHFGEGDDHYPEVAQTDTLRWSLTDTTITLTFASVDDLNRLLGCQLGDYRDGIGVPPGLEPNPSKPGFYLTARAHAGICGRHFFARKGGRRSQSLNAKEKFGCLEHPSSTPETPSKIEITATLHRRATPDQALSLKGLDKKVPFGTVVHPAFAKWNDVAVQGTPKDYFLAAFSCLSYLWTLTRDSGPVGLGLDADTFTEVADYVRTWSVAGVYQTEGDFRVACWMIAAVAKLPERTYPILYQQGDDKTVHGIFRPSVYGIGTPRIYALLEQASEIVGKAAAGHSIRRLRGIPIAVFRNRTDTAYPKVLANLENRRPWYLGLAPGVTCDRNKYEPGRKEFVGFNAREVQVLDLLHQQLGLPMERQISDRMSRLFNSLVRTYREHFHMEWDGARRRARRFAISTHLNRASNRSALLAALSAILKESDYHVGFTPDEMAWIYERAGKDPRGVQHLLILSCTLNSYTPKGGGQVPAATTPEVVTDEFADDDPDRYNGDAQ